MNDKNYWKNKYQSKWDPAADREKMIKDYLKQETGKKIVPSGLGTQSTEYISGSASENGFRKGDPDLQVEDTNIYIEVTGPLSIRVGEKAGLWFRPDKIENAYDNKDEHDTWLLHHLPKNDLIRVIQLDDEFFEEYKRDAFKIVKPIIDKSTETYVEIESTSKFIKSVEELIKHIKESLV